MKVHLIERNRLLKTEIFKFLLYAFIVYQITILMRIGLSLGEPVQFEKEMSYVAIFFLIVGTIFLLINTFTYKKIGCLEYDEDNFIIERKGLSSKINVLSIDEIKLKIIQGNIYFFKINNIKVEVALSKSELNIIKEICSDNNIKLEYKKYYIF